MVKGQFYFIFYFFSKEEGEERQGLWYYQVAMQQVHKQLYANEYKT